MTSLMFTFLLNEFDYIENNLVANFPVMSLVADYGSSDEDSVDAVDANEGDEIENSPVRSQLNANTDERSSKELI